MDHLILFTVIFLCHFLWCHATEYQFVPEEADVSEIPDPKFHIFTEKYGRNPFRCATLTVNSPVLQYCTTNQGYYAVFSQTAPHSTLLILMKHTNGEHLVNITLFGREFIINDLHYHNAGFTRKDGTEYIWISRVRKEFKIKVKKYEEYGGKYNLDGTDLKWVYANLSGKPCYESKVIMAKGSAKLCLHKRYIAFPIKLSTTTTTTTTTSSDNPEDDSSDSGVHKASLLGWVIYAGFGVLALLGTPLVSFLGYRTGRWLARRKALKKGLLKPDKLMAAAPVDGFGSNALSDSVKPPNTAKI